SAESIMSRIGASLLLCFTVALVSARHAQAEIWRCHQAGGPDLFTNWLKDPRTCQKYEGSAVFNSVPSSSTTTLPDVVPYQPMPVAEPPAPPETPREITEPYTGAGGEQGPSDYLYPYYPYSGGFGFPFIPGHPRHHHGHHHGQSTSHGAVTHSPGHGGGHGGHR